MQNGIRLFPFCYLDLNSLYHLFDLQAFQVTGALCCPHQWETWTSFCFTVLIKVLKKRGDPTLNYSSIVLLTALEMTHEETPRWRAASANRLECTKKCISLQNTHVPLHFRAFARNVLLHCAHDTKLHNIRKSIPT